MRGGMGNLMKQAQQMQQKMLKLQEEIAKKTLDASVGGGMVTVTVNGKSEVLGRDAMVLLGSAGERGKKMMTNVQSLLAKGSEPLMMRLDNATKSGETVTCEWTLAPLMDDVRARIGDHPVYLTYDIDSLDPAFAPGTGTPEAGGLSTVQVLTLLEELAELNWVGMDCVEVAPAYDHADITSLAAATFVWTYLCGRIASAPSP